MAKVVPFDEKLFAAHRRHLVVLAHPDDEMACAGLLQRMQPCRVVWLTNGDGLAARAGRARGPYVEERRRESIRAMAAVGIEEERLRFLGHSEVQIHRHMAAMMQGGGMAAARTYWRKCCADVLAQVRKTRPDVVWTLAYQGGHPGHDLTHLCTWAAVRTVSRELGRPIPIYEVPEYELGFLVTMRFPPWRRAPYHELRLTREERLRKERLTRSYPTQQRTVVGFRHLIRAYGILSAVRFAPFSPEEFAGREVFAPVPEDRRYSRSTHGTSKLDYVLLPLGKPRIRFDLVTRLIAEDLRQRHD